MLTLKLKSHYYIHTIGGFIINFSHKFITFQVFAQLIQLYKEPAKKLTGGDFCNEKKHEFLLTFKL